MKFLLKMFLSFLTSADHILFESRIVLLLEICLYLLFGFIQGCFSCNLKVVEGCNERQTQTLF